MNAFYTAKAAEVGRGEKKPRTLTDYRRTLTVTIDPFGCTRAVTDLRPDDFAALKAEFAKPSKAPTGLAEQISPFG